MNIIIISEPRTGGTLLSDILMCFNGFRNLGEMFWGYQSASGYEYDLKFTDDERISICGCDMPNVDAIRYISSDPYGSFMRMCSVISPIRLISVHISHYRRSKLGFLLTLPDTYFILLERKDKLKQYVSLELAMKSNIWINHNHTNKMYVNMNRYLGYRKSSIENYKEFRGILSDHNFLDLSYEDDLEFYSKPVILLKIKKWLISNGIRPVINDYEPRYKKQNNRDLRDIIVNHGMFSLDTPK